MKAKSSLRFTCPLCSKRIVVNDSLAGVTGPCPSCGDTITAPLLGVKKEVEIPPYEMPEYDAISSTRRELEHAPRKSHTLVKFLIAVIVLLLIVFAGYYYLNSIV